MQDWLRCLQDASNTSGGWQTLSSTMTSWCPWPVHFSMKRWERVLTVVKLSPVLTAVSFERHQHFQMADGMLMSCENVCGSRNKTALTKLSQSSSVRNHQNTKVSDYKSRLVMVEQQTRCDAMKTNPIRLRTSWNVERVSSCWAIDLRSSQCRCIIRDRAGSADSRLWSNVHGSRLQVAQLARWQKERPVPTAARMKCTLRKWRVLSMPTIICYQLSTTCDAPRTSCLIRSDPHAWQTN